MDDRSDINQQTFTYQVMTGYLTRATKLFRHNN